LALIEPGEVKIQVIKGAAAAAIFGEEASRGVIQIFMKK